MLNLHNIFRSMEGLSPLISDNVLNIEATKHAKRMARLGWLSDYGLQQNLDKLINDPLNNYEKIVYNISLGSNPEIACKSLINLPETRAHILGNYTNFGVGSYKNKNGMRYWTMLYGQLKNE